MIFLYFLIFMNYGKADLLLNENVLNSSLNISVNDYSFNSTIKSIDEGDSLPNINLDQIYDRKNVDFINRHYEIPMNRKYGSSNHKFSREKTFVDDKDIKSKILGDKKFAISYNDTIKTYLVNLFIFSEFSNPKKIEKDESVNVYFLIKNSLLNEFHYDINEVLENLKLASDEKNIIQNFLEEMNYFFKEKSYCEMLEKNNKYKKIILSAFIILLFILVISIFIFIIELKNRKSYFYLIIIFILIVITIIIIFLIFLIKKLIQMKLYKLFTEIIYMIQKYNDINKIIEKWNKNEFEKIRINVSVPISLNYIQFNIDPFQSIEIKHLNMSEIKNKFFPNETMSQSNFIEFQNIRKSLNYVDAPNN